MTDRYNLVRKVIEAQVQQEVALAPFFRVSWGNVPFEGTDGEAWVQVMIEYADATYATLLAPSLGMDMLSGVLIVNIYSEAGTGMGEGMRLAGRLRDRFSRAVLTDDRDLCSIHFDPPSGPRTIAPALPQNYSQTAMSFSFDAFVD